MDKQQILSVLEKLQVELADMQKVDSHKQQQLLAITQNIQQLMTQEEDLSSDQIDPVKANVQELLLQFETEHPILTSALNQVASGLANLGI